MTLKKLLGSLRFFKSDRLHCLDPTLRSLVSFSMALRRIFLHGTDEDASRRLERFDPVVLQGRKSLLSRETGENACRSNQSSCANGDG